MGVFDHFPYTNFHELNLEWILLALKEIQQTMEDFVSLNAIKYADPIQWNITRQYEKNTIVIDPLTGTAYISVRPVPSGAAITDENYWTVVFNLGQFVTKMAHNLANVVEPQTTLTATVSSSYNDWIIWGDVLYRNINPSGIVAGDAYVIGSNIEAFTVENVVGHIEDLSTTDKSNLVAAINEVLQTLSDTAGDLNDLSTADKSNLVAAINEVLQTLSDTAGDLNDLSTADKSNLVAAVNELVQSLIDEAERVDNITGDLDDLSTADKSNLVAAINEVFDDRAWVSSADFELAGDGITDDAAKFMEMVDYASTHNKSIKLESGKVFGIGRWINIPSYTMIDGGGSTISWLTENSVGFQCHGEIPSIDGTNPNPDAEQATGYNGHHDIIIKNITFDSHHPSVRRSCSVVTFHSKNVVIDNCTFIGDDNNHAMECNSSENVVINNCKFKDSIAGQDVTRTEINIDVAAYNGIPGYGTLSASYDDTACHNIFITNCTFDSVMSCFDSHGTKLVSGEILAPVKNIIIDNIMINNCEIIATLQSWDGFIISNVYASNLIGSYDNSFFRLRNARNGIVKNVTIDHVQNVLGTNANLLNLAKTEVDGVSGDCYNVTVDSITIICESTDLLRAVFIAGANNCNFSNIIVPKTGTTYLIAIATNPSTALVFDNIISNEVCNGLINLLEPTSGATIKNAYLPNNTEIGGNRGDLKIFNSIFKELNITNSGSLIESNVQRVNHNSDTVLFSAGYSQGAAVQAGSSADITITFTNKVFPVVPRAFVTQYGGNRPGMAYAVIQTTATTMTVRAFNNSQTDYTDCPFLWLAIRNANDR